MHVVQFNSQNTNTSTPLEVEVAVQKLETQKAFSWIIKVGIILSIALGFWYILLVNSLATRGFELEEERQNRTQIMKDVQKWDIALTIPTSLYALQSSERVQEMENIKNHEFVKINNGQLALR